MSIWSTIVEWCTKPATPCAVHWIDKGCVQPPYNDPPVAADETYLRITIAQMMLTNSREWFKELQPSVHGLVTCKFGDQSVQIPSLAAPDPKAFPDRAVLSGYRLLDLVPFRGNSVEVTAALVSIPGDDKLSNGIKALANIASLFSAPLGTVMAVADKLRESADLILGDGAGVHLGYHNTFTADAGASQLRSGYLAIVGASPTDLATSLPVVINDQLWLQRNGTNNPVGSDYILLRFEVLTHRDDMHNFTDIAAKRTAALNAFLAGPEDAGDAAYRAALAAILTHPELTNADRRTLAAELKADCDALRPANKAVRAPSVRTWGQLVSGLKWSSDQSPVRMDDFT